MSSVGDALSLKNISGIEVIFDPTNGGFQLTFLGHDWMGRRGGALYGNDWVRLEVAGQGAGSDILGNFEQIEGVCRADLSGLRIRCRIKLYAQHIVFEQEFEAALAGQPTEEKGDLNGQPGFAFPAFKGGRWEEHLAGLTYMNSREKISCFNHPIFFRGTAAASPQEGKNIPLIVTDSAFNTLVISPANYFMVGTVCTDARLPLLACGLSDAVHGIPKGTVYRTIFTFGRGVNRTMDRWGEALRRMHGVQPIDKYQDAGLTYLSYWTDAGAAYWYDVIPGMSYEQTLLAVAKHHRKKVIPVGVYQLDSWWYHRDGTYTGSVTRWLPKASTPLKRHNSLDGKGNEPHAVEVTLLPHGLESLQQKIGKPFIAHFKHLSPHSPYIAGNENSDPPVKQFRFIKECYAIPAGYEETVRFFRYICDQPGWGLATFEHDWINWIYHELAAMRDLHVGRNYLKGAADAMLAQDPGNNVVNHRTMQVCMSTPEITLQTVECQAITTIRTSYDTNLYVGELDRTCEGAWRWWWNVFAGRLVNALGKHSFHDCRLSKRPGKDHLSSNSELEFIMICLSCGILGLGDPLGEEDRNLIMRCVDSRGVILKPQQPAEPGDWCYLFDAYTPEAQAGVTLSAFNSFSTGRIRYVLDFNCNSAGRTVTSRYRPADMFEQSVEGTTEYVWYDFRSRGCARIRADAEIAQQIAPGDFSYHVLSPLTENRFAVIGNGEKFVTAAEKLIQEISFRKGELRVSLSEESGDAGTLVVYSESCPKTVLLSSRADGDGREERISWNWSPGSKLLSVAYPDAGKGEREVIVQ